MLYLLSCERVEKGGGVYAFDLQGGKLERRKYFPCDRPMYAVKSEKGLCVLLRQPDENDPFGKYFFVDENLEQASEAKSTQGVVPCHVCADGENVYVVNYLSGNVVKNGEKVLLRQGKSIHPTRQTQSHTHFVTKTPDGYFAICDLGADAIAFYDENLNLVSEANVPSGYGVRHLAFSKDGKYIYAVSELVPAVSVFVYRDGKAEPISTETIPCEKEKANGAAIRLSEDGKTLFVSLRVENEVCVFDADGERIVLRERIPCGGDSPRDFDVFGDYLIICNENSGNVAVYDRKSGTFSSDIRLLGALCCVID